MITVKLTTNFPHWPIIRQTPAYCGVWKDVQFLINQEVAECDYWVVYDDLLHPETTICSPYNTILITGEPPSVKSYQKHYTKQFETVLTCHESIKHRNKILSQQGLPWMIGGRYRTSDNQWERDYTKDYDELKAMGQVPKTKLISVMSSDKAFTPGHAQRLEFVRKLQNAFGDQIDVYGRGIRDVADKWDAIAPYRYHIVLENSSYRNYWTEKLSDAFLADAYPFYYGCPNILDYFSDRSLTRIDLIDADSAIETIKYSMAQDLDEQSRLSRDISKTLILDTYNMFEVMSQLCHNSTNQMPRSQITLKPQVMTVPPAQRVLAGAARKCRRLFKSVRSTPPLL